MFNKFVLLLTLILINTLNVNAQERSFRAFIIKEHLLQNGQLAIIAVDTAQQPLTHIKGTYKFVINGFEKKLYFRDGFAILNDSLVTSTFVFIKHLNSQGSYGQLYYIHKGSSGLKPITIHWYLLLIIPLLLIGIAYVFKKLIWIIVLLLVGLVYFNYQKGLDLTTFFETLTHGIKAMF